LVFVGIETGQQAVKGFTGSVRLTLGACLTGGNGLTRDSHPFCDVASAVMPCGDGVGTQPGSGLNKGIKLDFAVAKDIRIGGTAFFVFRKEVFHHAVFVGIAQVDHMKFYVQFSGYQFGHQHVIFIGAFA